MTLKIYIKNSVGAEHGITVWRNIQKKIEKKYPEKKYKIINILTKRGMYKIRGDQVFLYKLSSNITKQIEYKNINFQITEDLWNKEKEIFNIPFHHHLLKKDVIEYAINPKFKIIFEFINNKIFDFYFKTNIYKIAEIKQNLVSFLSILK